MRVLSFESLMMYTIYVRLRRLRVRLSEQCRLPRIKCGSF